MKLYIFTTDKDRSRHSLKLAAEKQSIQCELIFYRHLSIQTNTLFYKKKTLNIEKKDKIIVRWPWDANNIEKEYTILVKKILMDFESNIAFDKECLERFSPLYEDKLFQLLLFQNLHIPTPQTYYFLEKITQSLTFPIVLKKRVSSRGKNNFLVSSESQLIEKQKHIILSDYILQEFIEIEHDIRLVLFQDAIIGAVDRVIHKRKGDRLTVKGEKHFADVNKQIVTDCLQIKKELRADLIGFDVLLTKTGEYFFIEANVSPQYVKFEQATGISVSEKMIKAVVSNRL